jgi:LuxR family maltose regulon positive regulatory protein
MLQKLLAINNLSEKSPYFFEPTLRIPSEQATYLNQDRRYMLLHGYAAEQLDNSPFYLRIFTLGNFALIKNGQPLQSGRKPQRKPMEMLSIILAFGGSNVNEEHIMDALWPDRDGDMAHRSFSVALHRLRKLLGNHDIVQVHNGSVTLSRQLCWVDSWDYERLHSEAERLWQSAEAESGFEHAINVSLRAIAMYQGPFSSAASSDPWSLLYRDRLRSKHTRIVCKLGNHWMQCQRLDLAVECFLRSIENDPIDEEPFYHLMECYRKLGRREKALAMYNRCRDILSAVLSIKPSARLQKLKLEILEETQT